MTYQNTTTRTARVSTPPWISPAIMNGFGFVPRTDGDEFSTNITALRSIDQLLVIARTQPMRALTMLSNTIPELRRALRNGRTLGCGENAITMQAMKKGPDGKTKEEASEGTEAVRELFKNLPQEVGSFSQAHKQNWTMQNFTGYCAVEAVPGKRNQGLKEVWPIDTLTTRFFRDPATRLLGLWQRQRIYPPYLKAVRKMGGYIELPPDRIFWSALDGFPDQPYGDAAYASALYPVLEMMAFIKDLMSAWHRVGTPKWDIGFDYEMFARVAREQLGLTDKVDIENYIKSQLDQAVDEFMKLQADDAFFHDVKAKVAAVGSGGAWPDVAMIWDIIRWRLIMSLDEMPALMGVGQSGPEAWTGVEWQVYSQSLEASSWVAAKPLVAAGQLHLTLLGMPYELVAQVSTIRANQTMVEAQARQIEIDNEMTAYAAGFQTQNEAALNVVGHEAVAEPNKELLGLRPSTPPGSGPGAGTGNKNTGTKGPSKAG